MFKNQEDCRLAPGLGARILIMWNDTTIPPYIAVENKDTVNSAAIEYQESDDGSTWNTIVGTSKTINPGQADGQIVQTNGRQIALFAQGNVLLDINVTRQYNGDNLLLN